MPDYAALAQTLRDSLHLTHPPIAICISETVPAGVDEPQEAVPAGCVFWQEGTRGALATSTSDHELCAIGVHTHHLAAPSETLETELKTALQVMGELDYVRESEVAALPVIQRDVKHVIYAPLAETPLSPDVVMLFAHSQQGLVIAEAVQRVDDGVPPAMGRPACAVVPQAINAKRAALSLGCCGARAYLDALSDDVGLWALPGDKIERYCSEIARFAESNEVLAAFHRLRRLDVTAGQKPTVGESLERLQAQGQ